MVDSVNGTDRIVGGGVVATTAQYPWVAAINLGEKQFMYLAALDLMPI
jgi:hypothetical protein